MSDDRAQGSAINVGLLSELIDAVNRRDRAEIGRRCGPGLAAALEWWLDGHSDLHLEPDWVVADPGRVAAWITWSGTHDGSWTLPPSAGDLAFTPVEPTGRSWEASWTTVLEVRDGTFVDFRSAPDWLKILLALGLAEVGIHGSTSSGER